MEKRKDLTQNENRLVRAMHDPVVVRHIEGYIKRIYGVPKSMEKQPPTEQLINHIAIAAYNEVVKAMQASIKWESISSWRKNLYLEVTRRMLTDKITSTQTLHTTMVNIKQVNGWTYGRTFDLSLRRDPSLAAWESLSEKYQQMVCTIFDTVNEMFNQMVDGASRDEPKEEKEPIEVQEQEIAEKHYNDIVELYKCRPLGSLKGIRVTEELWNELSKLKSRLGVEEEFYKISKDPKEVRFMRESRNALELIDIPITVERSRLGSSLMNIIEKAPEPSNLDERRVTIKGIGTTSTSRNRVTIVNSAGTSLVTVEVNDDGSNLTVIQ